MTRDDIQKLLGGYATGTLTAEEQKALFEAALQDQDLFDALAREQALREVLEEPTARAHLLAALDERPAPWYSGWWRAIPAAVLATAFAAIAVVTLRPNFLQPARHLPIAKLPPAPAVASVPVLPPPPVILPPSPSPSVAPLSLPGIVPPAAPPPPPAQAVASLEKKAVLPMPAAPLPPQAAAPRAQASPTMNALLRPASVKVQGVVSDPAGAPVASATVEVKALDTGTVEALKTDAQGAFAATGVPGRQYEIKASAPGFEPATVNTVGSFDGASAPVSLQLAAGVVAETMTSSVMAPAGAGGRGGGGGRGGRGGALGGVAGASADAKAAPESLRYRVMRRLPAGDLSEVGADGNVAAGDDLVLQITPNADGYVRVTHDGRLVVTQAVRAGERFDAALPKFSQPERVELRLSFSRVPFGTQPTARAATAAGALASRAAAPASEFQLTVVLNVR